MTAEQALPESAMDSLPHLASTPEESATRSPRIPRSHPRSGAAVTERGPSGELFVESWPIPRRPALGAVLGAVPGAMPGRDGCLVERCALQSQFPGGAGEQAWQGGGVMGERLRSARSG